MEKRNSTIRVFVLLAFLVQFVSFAGNEIMVPVDGMKLYNAISASQEKNTAGEEMLVKALSNIHVEDIIRITPVNSKGEKGAAIHLDIEPDGANVTLRIGALLEFDMEKYKTKVAEPLQKILKQISINGGKMVKPTKPETGSYAKWKLNHYTLQYGEIENIEADGPIFNRIPPLDYSKGNRVGLNVEPNLSNIFDSTYEFYDLNLTDKIAKALIEKLLEGNTYDVHFVFKDETGKEVAHEIYQAMTNGDTNLKLEIKLARDNTSYTMFMPAHQKCFPFLITPEFKTAWHKWEDKTLIICEVSLKASTAKTIKSYEIFIKSIK